MSYAAVCVLSDWAIAATDTRSTVVFNPTEKEVYDLEPRKIEASDGQIITISAEDRKLRRFTGGWATGTGNILLTYECLNALSKSNAQTPDSIDVVLQQTYDQKIEGIRKQFETQDRIYTVIMCIYTERSQFKLHARSLGKNMLLNSSGSLLVSEPSDLDIINRKIVNDHFITGIQSSTDICDIIRIFSQAFHHVARSAPSVNDHLNLVLMQRLPNKSFVSRRLFTANTNIINWDNQQIAQALTLV